MAKKTTTTKKAPATAGAAAKIDAALAELNPIREGHREVQFAINKLRAAKKQLEIHESRQADLRRVEEERARREAEAKAEAARKAEEEAQQKIEAAAEGEGEPSGDGEPEGAGGEPETPSE